MLRICTILVALVTLSWPVAAQEERLAEIRVHGNYHTPDADVIVLTGLAIGQAVGPSTVQQARARLEASGRFAAVDIRKRYRSLDLTPDVALVIVIQEHPTPEAVPGAAMPAPLRPVRRILGSGMFLPILGYVDGYGLTYGARVSFVDGFGKGGRMSVPLTWGATRRAAAEFEKAMGGGLVDRLTATLSISRQINPHYEATDRRREVAVGASRQLGPLLASVRGGAAAVRFGRADTRLASYGTDLVLDTRADPVFPRNAVVAAAGWERLHVRDRSAVNRWRFEARGHVGLLRQTVLSVRARFARADGPLPPFERFLLGGAGTLRGYRAGSFAGDALAAASLELRVPISSPLSFGRAGLDVFADVGAAVDNGVPINGARFHPGYGAGVFLLASVFHLNADLGIRPATADHKGGVRFHLVSGFSF